MDKENFQRVKKRYKVGYFHLFFFSFGFHGWFFALMEFIKKGKMRKFTTISARVN